METISVTFAVAALLAHIAGFVMSRRGEKDAIIGLYVLALACLWASHALRGA